jgi:hypothetical protein
MTIRKICKDCQWNHYPECHGTILEDGSFLNIEEGIAPEGRFKCGIKSKETPFDWRIKPQTLEERLTELEKIVKGK